MNHLVLAQDRDFVFKSIMVIEMFIFRETNWTNAQNLCKSQSMLLPTVLTKSDVTELLMHFAQYWKAYITDTVSFIFVHAGSTYKQVNKLLSGQLIRMDLSIIKSHLFRPS